MYDVYTKLLYTGIPIDFYFAEILATVFCDILPCELMFRLIDICILESAVHGA